MVTTIAQPALLLEHLF